jgi:hydroxyacylglutathione hydrolase
MAEPPIYQSSKHAVAVLHTTDGEYENYCYLVWEQNQRQGVLIDPAWEPSLIRQVIEAQKVQPQAILLTHSHPDHVHLAGFFAQVYEIPVYISQTEFEFYQPLLEEVQYLDFAHPMRLGALSLQALPTPGHTKGGTSFLIGDFAFTGDTLFAEGCGNCDAPGGNPQEMFASLQRLKARLQPESLIFPGHSYGLPPGRTYREVLKKNIYLHIAEEKDFVRFRMRNSSHGHHNA